jgi:hypothetical protein
VDAAGNAMPYSKDKLLLFHGVTDGKILAISQSLPKTSSSLTAVRRLVLYLLSRTWKSGILKHRNLATLAEVPAKILL